MIQITRKLQLLLLIVISLNSLNESCLAKSLQLPDNGQFKSRVKRFGIFRPSAINRCILACDACSSKEPSYFDVVSHFEISKI